MRLPRISLVPLAVMVVACDQPQLLAPEPKDEMSEDHRAALLALGFDPSAAVDEGDHYLVEGDIEITKQGLASGMYRPLGPQIATFQYRTYAVVANGAADEILISINSNVPIAWTQAVRAAIGYWSTIPGVNVAIAEGVTSDISVGMGSITDPTVIARASWPSGGHPGPTITLDSDYLYWGTAAQKEFVVAHELGHTLGLRHSNWAANGESAGSEGAVQIPGTPTSDAASVMNAATGGTTWSDFSFYDKKAAIYLYPDVPAASVTYPSNIPTITMSMDEPPDTYEVELLVEWQIDMGWGEFMYDSTTYRVALGPSSVAVDSANQYTGSSVCYYGYDRMSTEYLITAHYAHGSTRTMDVPAAVADC